MYLGKVIVDDVSTNSIVQRKIRINKKLLMVGFSSQSTDNIKWFDELYVFVLKCYEEDKKKAFKILNNNDADVGEGVKRTLLIIRADDADDIYNISIEDTTTEEEHDFLLEGMFQGEFRFELEEDQATLSKRYDPTGNSKVIIIGGFFMAVCVLSFALWALFGPNKPSPEEMAAANELAAGQAQQAQIPPLTTDESFRLKRELSKELIDEIKKEVLVISSDVNLNGKAIIRSLTTTYDTVGDKIILKGIFGYEFAYPVEGSSLVSEEFYSKEKIFTIEKARPNLYGLPRDGMSVECIKMAMSLKSGTPIIIERTPTLLKFKYTQLRPTDFATDFKDVIDSCPIAIDTVSITNERFDLITTMYEGE